VKRSEFRTALSQYFEPRYAQAVLHDLRLQVIGSRTPAEALEAGEDPQRVWDAVCVELRLPEEARFPHRTEVSR
jgi:hypothetical protein